MKRFLLSLVFLLCLTGVACGKVVVVDGYGANQKQAESDALRNAVEQAVGVLVDSKSMVANSRLIDDKILTASQGYITDYRVTDKHKERNGWRVKIEANVDTNPNAKLMSDLAKLGIIETALRNPKVAVIIVDEHSGNKRSVAETSVIKAFRQAGFRQVTEATVAAQNRKIKNSSDEDMRNLANLLKVDILVVGSAVSENAGDVGKFIGDGYVRERNVDSSDSHYESINGYSSRDQNGGSGTLDSLYGNSSDSTAVFRRDTTINGNADSSIRESTRMSAGHLDTGMISARASVEARMYIAKTGRIVDAGNMEGSGADIAFRVAERAALMEAGEELGRYLSEQLINDGAGQRQTVEIVVKAPDFYKLNLIKDALNAVDGVKNVILSNYEDDRNEVTGVFNVGYAGSTEVLFTELSRRPGCQIELISSEYNSLKIWVN